MTVVPFANSTNGLTHGGVHSCAGGTTQGPAESSAPDSVGADKMTIAPTTLLRPSGDYSMRIRTAAGCRAPFDASDIVRAQMIAFDGGFGSVSFGNGNQLYRALLVRVRTEHSDTAYPMWGVDETHQDHTEVGGGPAPYNHQIRTTGGLPYWVLYVRGGPNPGWTQLVFGKPGVDSGWPNTPWLGPWDGQVTKGEWVVFFVEWPMLSGSSATGRFRAWAARLGQPAQEIVGLRNCANNYIGQTRGYPALGIYSSGLSGTADLEWGPASAFGNNRDELRQWQNDRLGYQFWTDLPVGGGTGNQSKTGLDAGSGLDLGSKVQTSGGGSGSELGLGTELAVVTKQGVTTIFIPIGLPDDDAHVGKTGATYPPADTDVVSTSATELVAKRSGTTGAAGTASRGPTPISGVSDYASSFSSGSITPSGNNRYIVVALNRRYGGTTTSVKFRRTSDNSLTNLSLILRSYDGGNRVATELWGAVAPPAAAGVVDVVLSNEQRVQYAVGCYQDVDQTSPVRGSAGAQGNSASPSVTIASATGDIVVDAVALLADTDQSLSVGASQTLLGAYGLASSGGAAVRGGASDEAGAASVTMSHSAGGSGNFWSIAAVALRAAPGSSGSAEVLDIHGRWDTGVIPDGETVLPSDLEIWVNFPSGFDEDGRSFVGEYVSDPFPITSADASNTAPNGNAFSVDFADLIPGQVNVIPLLNVSNINKTGYTAIRMGVSGGDPSATRNELRLAAYEDPTNPPMALRINYTTSVDELKSGGESGIADDFATVLIGGSTAPQLTDSGRGIDNAQVSTKLIAVDGSTIVRPRRIQLGPYAIDILYPDDADQMEGLR